MTYFHIQHTFSLNSIVYGTFRSLWMACPTNIRPSRILATSCCTVLKISPVKNAVEIIIIHTNTLLNFISKNAMIIIFFTNLNKNCNVNIVGI